MILPIRELQELVLDQAGADSDQLWADPFLARVVSALKSIDENPASVGPGDIAALVSQGMRRCHLARDETPELRVPKKSPWPDEHTWRLFKCEAAPAGFDHFLIRAQRWEPTWLDCGASAVVEAALREEDRRMSRSVIADPLVTEYTGFDHYATPGQREAVRASFLMPPGSTVVVNLPTGGGKTLAFQLPALVWAAEGGLVLVITPTIALARDQEERFKLLFEQHPLGRSWTDMPLAYHSGLDESAKSALRAAIGHGSIPILFVSPEAAMGALRGPLLETARQGRLRVFAIDEAHIVSQWGHQFRPEFQSIAGLRDALLDSCPPGASFRTLLLTATLTPESYQTLRQLFGQGCSQMVSEVSLRPEPGFLIYSAQSEPERCECVIEAIQHLPRPLILYTTLREHAESWYERLRDAGFRRLRLVRGGDLADADGERVLRDWRGRTLDIIVATSAFGLGMDQAEVRSIVHACLPETVDRYYQEVGRAGRDGKAAVSLLVSTPQDVQTAEGLAEEKLISTDRAFERWEAMWVRRRLNGDDAYVVSLDNRPPDIPGTGVRNASWNLRSLVLMARAGLIAFAAHSPPAIERHADEDDTSFEERRRNTLEQFSREVRVKIRDSRHSDRAFWNDVVARTRAELRDSDQEAIRLVRELRHLRRPLNELFREVYALSDPIIRPPRLAGSCPVTRPNGSVSFKCVDPDVTTITQTAAELSVNLDHALAPSLDEAGRSWVAYDSTSGDGRELRRWRERVFTLLRYAVSDGIVELCLPDGFVRDEEWSQLRARAPLRFLLRTVIDPTSVDQPRAQEVQVPRLTLLGERDSTPDTVAQIMRVHRPRHVIVMPRDAPDPTRPYRRLFDVVRHLSIEDLISRLGS